MILLQIRFVEITPKYIKYALKKDWKHVSQNNL